MVTHRNDLPQLVISTLKCLYIGHLEARTRRLLLGLIYSLEGYGRLCTLAQAVEVGRGGHGLLGWGL